MGGLTKIGIKLEKIMQQFDSVGHLLCDRSFNNDFNLNTSQAGLFFNASKQVL